MQKLGGRSNLIPVIAKADSLTEDELLSNKRLIKRDLEKAGIEVYQFGGQFRAANATDAAELDIDSEADDSQIQLELSRLQQILPFAVMCSSQLVEDDGSTQNRQHFRRFPWGTLNVESARGNDFSDLKSILLKTHTRELRDVTTQQIYEAYRTEKLQQC
jgi:septin family protein